VRLSFDNLLDDRLDTESESRHRGTPAHVVEDKTGRSKALLTPEQWTVQFDECANNFPEAPTGKPSARSFKMDRSFASRPVCGQQIAINRRHICMISPRPLAFLFSGLCLQALVNAADPPPQFTPEGVVGQARAGILVPGAGMSIYGQYLGSPTSGCAPSADNRSAGNLCDTQVLIGDKPATLLFVSDRQINFKVPLDVPPSDRAELRVVYRGQSSMPLTMQVGAEKTTISLDGVARVDGPVWIHVELPGSLGLSYPQMSNPWDFGCTRFEVRKDGNLLPPLSHPPVGGIYNGPPCPGEMSLRNTNGVKSRLPLHLQYRFTEPGVYEIRLTLEPPLFAGRGAIKAQSDWTPIQVVPAASRTIPSTHPDNPTEILSTFLPDLLAHPDDEALSVVLEYLYHPNVYVRQYASAALSLWPQSVVDSRRAETLRTKGPTPPTGDPMATQQAVEAALPWFSSSDPVLFKRAITDARNALDPTATINPETRSLLEQALIAGVPNLDRADAQTIDDFVSVLGRIHNERVHDVLWSLADRHTGTEQALIAIASQNDPKDFPRLAVLLIEVPADAPPGKTLSGVPHAMSALAASRSWLETVLAKAQSPAVRIRCAQELMRVYDRAGFAFARDAFENNLSWKDEIGTVVNEEFPETRDKSDTEMVAFLRGRSQ
jgi:hypothetical protein